MPNWKKLLTSGSNIQISALTLDADGVTKTSIDSSGNIAAEGYVSSSGVVSGTSFKLNTNGATAVSIDANGLAVFNSTVKTTGLIIGSTAVTSTAAEINKLDGFTGDKDDLIYAKDLKATGVTATEFDYLDGVTSAIQTQIDSKTSNVVGNLGVVANGTSLTITTANGSNIAIPEATTSAWGAMSDGLVSAIAANTAKDTNVETDDASAETKGKVALASNEEAIDGGDTTKALTPRAGTAMAAAITLTTAAQTNITSIGTLGSLTVTGNINANGNIVGDDGTDITNIETIECDNIVHDGDTDTKIAFGTDSITLTAGGADLITLTEATVNTIVLEDAPTTLTGNVTASGAISGSGVIIGNAGANAGYTVRPNLYFFATNTGAVTMAQFGSGTTDNQGALPATNTTTVTLSQEQNSHTSIFSLSSNRITIARAGLYKITYNALLEINNGSNRIEGFVGLVQETSGGTVTLIDGSEGRGYHRFVNTSRPSAVTYGASIMVDVAADSIYDLRFGMTKQSNASQKLRTMPTGTSFLIEAVT